MSSMNQALSSAGLNVVAFRGCAVVSGVVVVTDGDLISHLNATYSEVVVCNIAMQPGEVLHCMVSPKKWEEVRREYQLELSGELQSQLANGNDVDITYS